MRTGKSALERLSWPVKKTKERLGVILQKSKKLESANRGKYNIERRVQEKRGGRGGRQSRKRSTGGGE